jgi:hypothetical protein
VLAAAAAAAERAVRRRIMQAPVRQQAALAGW